MRLTTQKTTTQPSTVPLTTGQGPALASRWLMFCVAVVALAIAGFAGLAKATPIAVINAGFEEPAGPDGVLANSNPMPGWFKTGGGQIYNPGNNANAVQGSNSYLILNGVSGYDLGSGSIEQTLADVLREGVYTLSVAVGENATLDSVFGSYQVQLGVMNGTTFVLLAEDNNTLSPSNQFLTSTVEFTAAAGNPNLGRPLVIRLVGTVAGTGNNQVLFDDVHLDLVATPVDVVVNLQAQRFDKELPGGGTVPMWGFATCTDAAFTSCSLPAETDAPGPRIDAFTGYSLTINLKNTLPVPVSIEIPGQAGGGDPEMMASDTRRVQSFTHETAANATNVYTWSTLRPGTYLYQSGTQPSIQVPMGLYGALAVHQDGVQAYPGISPDGEVLLLFSEIDPLQNQRVDNAGLAAPTAACVSLADFAQSMTAGYPCTIDYNPMYFLVNGAPTADLPAGLGDNVLLRLLNAGLRSHTPSIVGLELGLIAEDGNLYPGLPREQSAALLAAGKTLDALVTMPATDITLSLFDRMPTFSNENLPNGGSLGSLTVGTGTVVVPPVASLAQDDGPYAVTEDTALSVPAGSGVLANDGGLSGPVVVSGPANGGVSLGGDGSFTYTPNANYSGIDSFTYSASDGSGSYRAQVTLDVSFENDAPVASADGPFVNTIGADISIPAPGVLGNDSDPDGDTLTAVIEGPTPAGLTLNPNGSFTYTGGVATNFSYRADDGTAQSAPVIVSLEANPVAGIALTVQDFLGNAVTDYRWLVQEEATYHNNPLAPDPIIDQMSLNFHKSYMPVVAQGSGASEFAQVALDPAKHYYVSVLPNDAGSGQGHSIGGAQIPPGATSASVIVNNQEIPTAQISAFVFDDNSPTNGVPDADEPGLGGFQIVLEDAGGRYGISGGTMSQDAYGNPLRNAIDCFGGAPPPMGVILTCPDTPANQAAGNVGQVQIVDLPPGKYGVIAVAPSGNWIQTSTIEGTKVIDAWVKAAEPPFFLEFGNPGFHAFIGFVDPVTRTVPAGSTTSNAFNGHVTLLHDPRPPGAPGTTDSGSYAGLSHTRAWVGLNTIGGDGENIQTVQADADGNFEMSGIPDGSYQLVVWDTYLDQVIAMQVVNLPADVGDIGNVPVNAWFTRAEHNVFLDENENGVLDAGEAPLPEQAINLRWRDGTINQSFPTDTEGFVPFDQTFPFFSWQVFEVDYTRFKATGMTVVVDGGGDVSGGDYPGLLNPQIQLDGALSRTEVGPVLTQGFQGFPGQTSIFDWGKKPYAPGENGGISGIVYYGSTRGENDPRLTVGDPWEPGIPGVKVRLYREVARDPTSGVSSITVTNPGFEYPAGPVGSGGVIDNVVDGSDPLTGWVKTGGGQIYNPGNDANAPEGSNSYLILNGVSGYDTGSGSVEQKLGDVLQEGTYTLRVAVGENVTSTSIFGSYQVQLGVYNAGTFVLLAEDNNTLSPSNQFLTSTVSYTAAASNLNLGLPLMIRLVGTVADTGNNQVLFDDVHLDYAAPGSTTALALVQEVETDSWDAAPPDGCPGEDPAQAFTIETLGLANLTRCYDGWRNWNQVRPGVFDGGYAFNDIPPGKYVVEVVPPPGYELIKEEDVNVGFGDAFGNTVYAPVAVVLPGGALLLAIPDPAMVVAAMAAEPGLAQPPCVGADHLVPPYLSLFPGEMVEAPFANATRPLCDRKEVILSDQGQAAADFHLFTSTPVAAQFAGLITDDISTETNPASPGFGEKWSPAYLPFSIRDFRGQEVYRGHSDAYGRYNGVLPSTFTANIPIPSGYSPSMMSACLNDAGPQQLANYTVACYTAQFMPGATTYLDTPILPTAGFAAGFNHPDCAAPQGTPVIQQVNGSGAGPWINTEGPAPQQRLVIQSSGNTVVPNPAYEGPLATAPYNQPTITRDLGFGTVQGTVTVGGVPLVISGWNNGVIQADLPTGVTVPTGELVVTRGDNGNSTISAVTVTISSATLDAPLRVGPAETYQTIQAAIDAAPNGALILVGPGTYNEQVVMWKPVRLQGSGAASVINALKIPIESLQAWLDKTNGLITSGAVDLLPGQTDLATEQGAGITVLSKGTGPSRFALYPSRIDGFTITGADSGGGIFVNGYANNLEIANNTITGNSGTLHGGIRVGQPFLPDLVPNANGVITFNNNVNIHHNAVTSNGALHFESAGGGISLSTGSSNYLVSHNFVCGNFTAGDGAGIGHLGVSNNGTIEFNRILYNQSYNQGLNQHGGGIYIAGEPAAPPALTLGTGNVTVDANLVQGNHAGSGHGGGIRTQLANGAEIAVRANPWLVRITNNMIVNNVAAWAGAGISLQDTIRSQVINNTVTNNDSTATVGGLIVANVSDPQPAGIVAERHSPGLAAAVGDPNGFSSPLSFQNNIVWHNRAFSYGTLASATPGLLPELAPTTVGGCAAGADYWDLGVLGEPRPTPTLMLDPRWSILTDTTGYHGSNLSGDPDFLSEYCNGARTLSTPGPMLATAAFGEGGNFVDVRFGPLTQEWPAGSGAWDYHIGAASSGLDNGNVAGGTNPPFNHDFDNDPRPIGTGTPSGKDRGADEFVPPPALSSIAPASSTTVQRGSSIPVTLTGTGLNGATAVSVSGSGVAVVSFTVDSDTQITATFEISSGGGNRGAKDVSVTTSGGTSNTVTFTKN